MLKIAYQTLRVHAEPLISGGFTLKRNSLHGLSVAPLSMMHSILYWITLSLVALLL